MGTLWRCGICIGMIAASSALAARQVSRHRAGAVKRPSGERSQARW